MHVQICKGDCIEAKTVNHDDKELLPVYKLPFFGTRGCGKAKADFQKIEESCVVLVTEVPPDCNCQKSITFNGTGSESQNVKQTYDNWCCGSWKGE